MCLGKRGKNGKLRGPQGHYWRAGPCMKFLNCLQILMLAISFIFQTKEAVGKAREFEDFGKRGSRLGSTGKCRARQSFSRPYMTLPVYVSVSVYHLSTSPTPSGRLSYPSLCLHIYLSRLPTLPLHVCITTGTQLNCHGCSRLLGQ